MTFHPDTDYKLSALTIDGKEIPVEDVVNNSYVMENVDKDVVYVEAIFAPLYETYTITYASLSGKGTYASSPRTVKEGNALVVSISPLAKYKVESVTFNDQPMEKIEENKYQIIPHESGKVKVVFVAATVDSSSENDSSSGNEQLPVENPSENGGCAGAVNPVVFGIAPLLLLCTVSKKRTSLKNSFSSSLKG